MAKADQEPGQGPWLSLGGTLEEVAARGLYEIKESRAEFYVEKGSLAVRGLKAEDLVEDLEPADHCKVRELLAANLLQLIF